MNPTETIYCDSRRTVVVPLSIVRRNGAADTAMGATATANKDAVERRMFFQVQIKRKCLVAKGRISLLSAREGCKECKKEWPRARPGCPEIPAVDELA